MAGRLARLDLERSLPMEVYELEMDRLQLALLGYQQKLRHSGRSVVIVFEGSDAAGKGGAIKRLVQRLDPRGYQVFPIGAPTEEELRHHFLWRFWKGLPGHGRIAIFDRSWYGRVLVERVEQLIPKPRWKAAYEQINAFEKMIVDEGAVVLKFWFQISKAEQLRRFQKRQKNPLKRWKMSPDDWRNRRNWAKYISAAEEMFRRTDTRQAPWRIIEAECKLYARAKTLHETAEAMRGALKAAPVKRKR